MYKLLIKNKKYLMFVSIIILVGVCSGIIYYNLLNSEIKESINYTMLNYNNFRYNNIFKDLIIMSLLLVTSLFIIGIPIALFYIFYEGLALGLILNIFSETFNISGLVYGIIYLLINKLLVLILMIFFIKKLIFISRFVVGTIIYKRDTSIKNKLMKNLKNSIYLIVVVFFINIVLYFVSPFIFSNLIFLLK